MGISLVTPGTPTAANAGSANPNLSGDSVVTGFADMLSQQLLDLSKGLTITATQATDDKESKSASLLDTSANDSIQLLAGLPLMPTVPFQKAAPTAPAAEIGAARLIASDPQVALTAQAESALTLPRDAAQSKAAMVAPGEFALTLAGNKNELGPANLAVSANADTSHGDYLSALTGQAAQTSAAGRPAVTASNIPTPLHETRWAQDFGDKVVWLAKNDQQSAQISINPPHLGPMQITLNLNGDRATAVFASPHAEVRQAIEDALPRLREMLAGAGIDLGQANVGGQLAQRDANQQGAKPDAPRFSSDKAILSGEVNSTITTSINAFRSGRGMVDLFA